MQRILREVYGVDLFNPPEEAGAPAEFRRSRNRRTWEGYSPEKWREIRRAFGVTQVLTYRRLDAAAAGRGAEPPLAAL